MIIAMLVPRLRNNRAQRRLIDVQLKHIRSAIIAGNVEVELPAADLAEIKRRRQNGFALELRPREYLAQRADNCAAATASPSRCVCRPGASIAASR